MCLYPFSSRHWLHSATQQAVTRQLCFKRCRLSHVSVSSRGACRIRYVSFACRLSDSHLQVATMEGSSSPQGSPSDSFSVFGVGLLLHALILRPLFYVFSVAIPWFLISLFAVISYLVSWVLFVLSLLVAPVLWPAKVLVWNPTLGIMAFAYRVRRNDAAKHSERKTASDSSLSISCPAFAVMDDQSRYLLYFLAAAILFGSALGWLSSILSHYPKASHKPNASVKERGWIDTSSKKGKTVSGELTDQRAGGTIREPMADSLYKPPPPKPRAYSTQSPPQLHEAGPPSSKPADLFFASSVPRPPRATDATTTSQTAVSGDRDRFADAMNRLAERRKRKQGQGQGRSAVKEEEEDWEDM